MARFAITSHLTSMVSFVLYLPSLNVVISAVCNITSMVSFSHSPPRLMGPNNSAGSVSALQQQQQQQQKQILRLESATTMSSIGYHHHPQQINFSYVDVDHSRYYRTNKSPQPQINPSPSPSIPPLHTYLLRKSAKVALQIQTRLLAQIQEGVIK
eukprot:scaffold12683_cov144-Skeletonema_dohrnii-CCMP3373.AAC.2